MTRSLSSLNTRLRRWTRYRATVRQLENLTNRELTDIGIRRADIRRHARAVSAI